MSTDATNAKHQPIDPALLRRIVREVIARLSNNNPPSHSTSTNTTAVSICDRIVSAATIDNISGKPSQIFVSRNAVITPAARDAANERSITINRSVEIPATQRPIQQSAEITASNTSSTELPEIIDTANPSRVEAFQAQLARRGMTGSGGATLVLSDTPAKDVHHFCAEQGRRATMIATITDVDRFANELNPDVWVLDMTRMNLVTATNTAARIIQLGRRT